MFTDYYKIVQLHPECDDILIGKIRKVFASIIHPDLAATETLRAEYGERMKQINNAIDILSDPDRRRDYNSRHPYFQAGSGNQYGNSSVAYSEESPENEDCSGEDNGTGYSYSSDISINYRRFLRSEILFGIAKAAKWNGLFTPFQRKMFYNFGKRIKDDLPFSAWMIENFPLYMDMAVSEGLI